MFLSKHFKYQRGREKDDRLEIVVMMPHDDLSVAESHQRRDALTRSEARNKKRGLTHKKRH